MRQSEKDALPAVKHEDARLTLHVCLACRHIVKYLGFGHDEPMPTDSETQVPAPSCTYLVQEYLESGTLKSLVLKQVHGLVWLLDGRPALRSKLPWQVLVLGVRDA